MSDLVSRLLAAIEQEEQDAPNIHHKDCRSVSYVGVTEGAECDCGKPAAVLRHCDADRTIIALHALHDPIYPEIRICRVCHDYSIHDAAAWPCQTLTALASAYGLSVEEETTHE